MSTDEEYFYNTYKKLAGRPVSHKNNTLIGHLVGIHKHGHNIMCHSLMNDAYGDGFYYRDYNDLTYNWESYMLFNKDNFVAGYFLRCLASEVLIQPLDKDELENLIKKLEL